MGGTPEDPVRTALWEAQKGRKPPPVPVPDLSGETDATVWAEWFIRVVEDDPRKALDFGLMVSWFANAIEAGRHAGRVAALDGLEGGD